MQNDYFEITPGPDLRSLRITYRGFWTHETVDMYHRALQQRAGAAGGSTPTKRVLLDVKSCVVQSLDVMDRIDAILESYRSQIDEYGVLLPDARLFRLQMMRVMQSRPVAFFQTEEEAAVWLANGSAPIPSQARHISS